MATGPMQATINTLWDMGWLPLKPEVRVLPGREQALVNGRSHRSHWSNRSDRCYRQSICGRLVNFDVIPKRPNGSS